MIINMTSFVHRVQKILINYMKINYPHIIMLFYFSDEYAGQYKNHKNFISLCHHRDDFGLDAQWIFFATSHGKSPCDGVGGFVKRHVAKRSLQHPLNNQILDHKAMISLCIEEIKNIEVIEISQEEMQVF